MSAPDPIAPVEVESAKAERGRYAPGLLVALLALAFAVALGTGSGWETVRDNLDAWQAWADRNPVAASLSFFAVYVALAALPLPVLTVMSLLAGCLFGRWLGTGLASLAYTAGVTASFLSARALLRESLRSRFGRWVGPVERGVERDGAYYLLALRLMPAIPFFLVNWLMALTPIRTRTFSLVSWFGVLPMTFLYTGVGTELGALESPTDVLSPTLLLSLAALAVVPLLIRLVVRWGFQLRKEQG